MNYLLDTCIISELRKKTPDKKILDWFQNKESERTFLSALTIGEVFQGIYQVKTSSKRDDLLRWVDEILQAFEGRILSCDLDIAQIWGVKSAELRSQGKALAVIDGLLAATALSKSMTFVTRNVDHIKLTGVVYINPWERI